MGSGFSSASNIMIGGAACKIGTVTQSLLQCLTAPHTAGTVDIVLTNPDGQTAILPAGFTYASVTQFAATDEYMCAVYSNGALVCWGGNSTGQIGNGSTGSYAAPTMVFTSGVTEVAVSHGGHTCALMTGGSVQCWGNNGSGQLGTGSYSPSTAPSGAISGLPSTAHLYLGLDHSCAVTTGGALYCWGLNSNGACCAPTIAYNVQSSVPTAHEIYASGVSTSPYQVATGVYNTCANIGGEIRCWGGGADNQLGNSGAGDVNNTSYLTISGGGLSLSSLSGNSDDVCAMDSSGLECWGPNASGQDGNGANSAISSRTTIDSTNPITQTFMSGDHTCALTSAGNVFCWGGGVAYQLGNNATSSQNSEPSAIAGGAIKLPFGTTGITQISGGAGYSCALQNGDVFCWGSQAAGAGILGYLSPTAVSNPETSPRSSPP
jgi:alpha-tubulin suppressor-like RCC1 family protein